LSYSKSPDIFRVDMGFSRFSILDDGNLGCEISGNFFSIIFSSFIYPSLMSSDSSIEILSPVLSISDFIVDGLMFSNSANSLSFSF
jgi:hypothetical protein